MTESRLVELEDQLRHAERRLGMARVAAVLAHALGTPLNVISGRAALIARPPRNSRSDPIQNAVIIERQVEALAQRIQRALDYLRAERDPVELCDIGALLEDARMLHASLAAERGIAVEVEPAAYSAQIPRAACVQGVVDLLSLGLQTVERGNKITLSARVGRLDPPSTERGRAVSGEMASFAVVYGGVHLDPELFKNPYEPWESPQPANPTLALLLAVCFGLARDHSGWIEWQPLESGTRIVMSLPAG